jgi:hypothetical protein
LRKRSIAESWANFLERALHIFIDLGIASWIGRSTWIQDRNQLDEEALSLSQVVDLEIEDSKVVKIMTNANAYEMTSEDVTVVVTRGWTSANLE